jgi:hypothetical protein
MKSKERLLVVDLDGVLCEETGRWDDYATRSLLPGAILKLKALSEIYEVTLYTARPSDEAFWDTVRWLQKHGIDKLVRRVIFDKPRGVCYVDDRAIMNLDELFEPAALDETLNKGE